MSLAARHQQQGATLAPDGIPLHYSDEAAEDTAFASVALLDRSHEGRLRLSGADRLAFLHRMSTNSITTLQTGAGCVTLFLTPQGRIAERAYVYNGTEDALLINEPGRGQALHSLLQRHIFYQDRVTITDASAETVHLALHGPQAESLMRSLGANVDSIPALGGGDIMVDGASVLAVRRKPIRGAHWGLIVPAAHADRVWDIMAGRVAEQGGRPVGSLAYHRQRVAAGYPAGREVSSEYLPLEVGLWDDLHFAKGCYTGQEIIARMESRERVARLLIQIRLDAFVDAPAPVLREGREIGTVTSSAALAGNVWGLAVVKREAAVIGQMVQVGNVNAQITRWAGVWPPFLSPADQESD